LPLICLRMRTLIVYDSVYGNTEKIAKAIAEGVADEVEVHRTSETGMLKPGEFHIIIVGSPTHGGRPTPAVTGFIKEAGPAFKGIKVAAFDTRMTNRFVGIFGYAAGRIGDRLKSLGGSLVASPEGFYVKGSQGPLKEGELERAASWAREIVKGLE
jgi:flavodoxin I